MRSLKALELKLICVQQTYRPSFSLFDQQRLVTSLASPSTSAPRIDVLGDWTERYVGPSLRLVATRPADSDYRGARLSGADALAAHCPLTRNGLWEHTVKDQPFNAGTSFKISNESSSLLKKEVKVVEERVGRLTSKDSAQGYGMDVLESVFRIEEVSPHEDRDPTSANTPSPRLAPSYPLKIGGDMRQVGVLDLSRVCGTEDAVKTISGPCRKVFESMLKNFHSPRFIGPLAQRKTGSGKAERPTELGSSPLDFDFGEFLRALEGVTRAEISATDATSRRPQTRSTLPVYAPNGKPDRLGQLGEIKTGSFKLLKPEKTTKGWGRETMIKLGPATVDKARKIITGEFGGRCGGWTEPSAEALAAQASQEEAERRREKPKATADAVRKAFAATREAAELRKEWEERREEEGGGKRRKGKGKGKETVEDRPEDDPDSAYSKRLVALIDDPPPFVPDPTDLPLFHRLPLANLLTGTERFHLHQVATEDFVVLGIDPGEVFAIAGAIDGFNDRDEPVTRFVKIKSKGLQESIRVEARKKQRWRDDLTFPPPAPFKEVLEGIVETPRQKEDRRVQWRLEERTSEVMAEVRFQTRSSGGAARRRRAAGDSLRARAYAAIKERMGLSSMESRTARPSLDLADQSSPTPSTSDSPPPRPANEATWTNLSSRKRRGVLVFVGKEGQRKAGHKLSGIDTAEFGTAFTRGLLNSIVNDGHFLVACLTREEFTSQICSTDCYETLPDGSRVARHK